MKPIKPKFGRYDRHHEIVADTSLGERSFLLAINWGRYGAGTELTPSEAKCLGQRLLKWAEKQKRGGK